MRVSAAIEAKAASTSFAELDRFGRQALRLPSPERLNRLYHVAWTYLNQGEFGSFRTWNRLLARQAALAHSHRFAVVARISELRNRYDEGDQGTASEIRRIAASDPDWFVRVDAMRMVAYLQIREAQAGSALRTLSDAETLVPDTDPMASPARSGIWEFEGLALMNLQDIKGAAEAFGRQEFLYGSPGYPRPDYDGIINLASLAARTGDKPLAAKLSTAVHRLALRSGLASTRGWDRVVCTRVTQHTSPRDMLACFDDIGVDLKAESFLAPKLLPARAIAEAETGHAADAARDLAAAHRLLASHAFPEAQFQRLPEADAAVLEAQGRHKEAYDLLLQASEQDRLTAAKRFSAGIGQVTEEMQRQLEMRRDQLETARRNVTLQRDVISVQRLLDGVVLLVTLSAVGLLFWQWRVAEQLRRAREAADAANLAKGEFLANMSHEIRTPLNGVVAMADMLARADLAPRAREMAEIIRSSGDTLQRLLSDILDMARIESGKIAIEAAPFHVGDMVRAVAGLSQLKCDEKGVRLVVEITPEIDGPVMGDLVRVRQVLTNLLSNATKFTEAGEVRLVAERTAEGLARFTVSDTGVGFSMTDKAKVLGRFEQADSSITRRFGGTGLGLSICCDLAGLMGGSLDCSSVPGLGSRFWMELPLEPATLDATASESAETAPEGEPLRILLADDHPTNRKVVELMLDGGLAELTFVEDGAQALDMFQKQRFDLILMDMQMPVMDGIAAIREIRRLEARDTLLRTPIVMLTANALPDQIAAAAAAGADLHLAKPFTAHALFTAINAVAWPEPPTQEAAA